MLARTAADLVMVLHLGFVVFVVAGGLLALRWPRVAWLHLPAAAWGALIEFGGWVCPLTPLENRLRVAGGGEGYSGSFVEHTIAPIVYPAGLSPAIQLWLGVAVVAINVVVYAAVVRRVRRRRGRPS
jgi:hypothetical protein